MEFLLGRNVNSYDTIFRQRMREEEDLAYEKRRQMIQRRRNPQPPRTFLQRFIPQVILVNRRSVIMTTAFSIVIGIFAYYYKNHGQLQVDVFR